jgi:hypothetical protein
MLEEVNFLVESAEEAMEKAREMLWEGEINTIEFEPFTEVHYAEQVK